MVHQEIRESVQFPGTSININPLSGAGFGGASTAIIIGPFNSKADAESDAATGKYPANVTGSGNETSIPNAVPGLQSIGAFFAALGNAKLWERIATGIIGIILIATGVSHLAGNSTAGQIARKIPLVV